MIDPQEIENVYVYDGEYTGTGWGRGSNVMGE